MKKAFSLLILFTAIGILSGCASMGPSNARIAPPEEFNVEFLKYQNAPGEKVLVLAVDVDGNWAYGFDHSESSLEEAAKNAARNCDAARTENKVITTGKLFAVNNDVVYYKNAAK